MRDENSETDRSNDMSEHDALANAAALISAAFPNLRCLRCDAENFELLDAQVFTVRLVKEHRSGPVHFRPHPRSVTLVCTTCGMMEQHVLEFLEKADKPISGGKDVQHRSR